MGLASHFRFRLALMFAGFIGGFALFVWQVDNLRGYEPFAFFGFIFGGAFLLPLVFAKLVPSVCPYCNGLAWGLTTNPFRYQCASCGRGVAADVMPAPPPAAYANPQSSSAVLWAFFIVGIGSLGLAAFLAWDSVRLVSGGVSTDARVARLAQVMGRSSDNKQEVKYTAYIEYPVGKGTMMLEHSWTEKEGSSCVAGCSYLRDGPLKVIYLPSEPSIAKIDSFTALFFPPLLVGLFGVFFTVVGILVLRHKPRRPRLEL